MIHIVFKNHSLKVSGHAEYADKGQDLVCAGVSAIVMGAINWFGKDEIDLILDEQEPLIEIDLIKKNDETLKKMELIYLQLQAIQKKYCQYIKIKREI